MVGSADEAADDESEVVAVLNQPRWVGEILRELSISSPGRQIAIGGVSGLWVSAVIALC